MLLKVMLLKVIMFDYLIGHFLMATGDRHGAIWMNTCHSDCCSRQGLQEILNTIYRDERDLTKVKL